MTTEELPPFRQIHQSSFAGHASASKRIPAHKHPHKSFVITRVATVKALHQVWYGLLMLAREVQGDRKWDLGEYINPQRSAKYSSNFTPEWIKTWPFVFFAGDRGKLQGSNSAIRYETYVPHHSTVFAAAGEGITFIPLQSSIQLFN